MYSGQGYHYPPPSTIYDDPTLPYAHNQPAYYAAPYQQQPQDPRYPMYLNPSSSAQVPPPDSAPYYPSQSYYAAPAPPAHQPPQSIRTPRYEPRQIPQHLVDDPAFSDDPRMNPHFTMNDREEITPTESSYPDYSYPLRDSPRPGTISRGELQAAHGPIYGPPVIPGKLSQTSSSRSLPRESNQSLYTSSLYAQSTEIPRKSYESVHLAYDDPAAAEKSSSSISASQMAKSNKSSSAYSSTSSSFVNVAPPSPYEIFIPRPPSASSSSSDSSPPPRTPPAVPYTIPSEVKGSTSSLPRGALAATNPDASPEIKEAPPAYTRLPTPSDSTFIPTVSASDVNAISASSAIPPAPVEAVVGQKAAFEGENTIAFPTPSSVPETHTLAKEVVDQPSSSSAMAPPHGTAPEAIRMQRSRSRKNSIPKDLDKIDELDETDPLGYAWHHESPYEAISRAVESGLVPGEGAERTGGRPKIFAALPDPDVSQVQSHRKPVAVDPNLTAFKVKPGQIFPSIIATSHAHVGHQQMFGHSSAQATASAQQPAPRSYTNAHMRPGVHHHLPPPKPVFPPPQAVEDRSPSQPAYAAQPNSSNGSLSSGRREEVYPGSNSSHQAQKSRSSLSNTSSKTLSRPLLAHQASNMSLSRSASVPSTRAQGISSEAIPRPDIRLPPRGVPSTTSSHQSSGPPRQPHYLPKHLVMPTPLQPQQTAPSGASGRSGELNSGADARSRENQSQRQKELAYLRGRENDLDQGPGSGAPLKHSASVPSRAPKAQDIPMSSKRHLLKKVKETGDAGYPEPEREKPKEKERGGVHFGGFTIIPAFGHGHSSSGGANAAKHGPKGWEKELEREREKEKPKDKGRKLSKRR